MKIETKNKIKELENRILQNNADDIGIFAEAIGLEGTATAIRYGDSLLGNRCSGYYNGYRIEVPVKRSYKKLPNGKMLIHAIGGNYRKIKYPILMDLEQGINKLEIYADLSKNFESFFYSTAKALIKDFNPFFCSISTLSDSRITEKISDWKKKYQKDIEYLQNI